MCGVQVPDVIATCRLSSAGAGCYYNCREYAQVPTIKRNFRLFTLYRVGAGYRLNLPDIRYILFFDYRRVRTMPARTPFINRSSPSFDSNSLNNHGQTPKRMYDMVSRELQRRLATGDICRSLYEENASARAGSTGKFYYFISGRSKTTHRSMEHIR